MTVFHHHPLATVLLCCLVCTLCVSYAAFIIGKRVGRRPGVEGYVNSVGSSYANLASVVQELKATREAIAAHGKKEQWTYKHADVFECFMYVNGMPPTDSALDHYMFVSANSRLSRADLVKRIKADMPPEMADEK